MGINNDGYTLHINLTKEEFQAIRELVNLMDDQQIFNHVSSKRPEISMEVYTEAGNKLWDEIALASSERTELHFGQSIRGKS